MAVPESSRHAQSAGISTTDLTSHASPALSFLFCVHGCCLSHSHDVGKQLALLSVAQVLSPSAQFSHVYLQRTLVICSPPITCSLAAKWPFAGNNPQRQSFAHGETVGCLRDGGEERELVMVCVWGGVTRGEDCVHQRDAAKLLQQQERVGIRTGG